MPPLNCREVKTKKAGENEYLDENTGLVLHFYKSVRRSNYKKANDLLYPEEIHQAAFMGAYQGYRQYKTDRKAKLSYYVWLKMKGEIVKFVQQERRFSQFLRLDDPVDNNQNEEGMEFYDVIPSPSVRPDTMTFLKLRSEELVIFIRRNLKNLTPRQKEILSVLYGLENKEPLTFLEAALYFNVTHQTIRQTSAHFFKIIRDRLRKKFELSSVDHNWLVKTMHLLNEVDARHNWRFFKK